MESVVTATENPIENAPLRSSQRAVDEDESEMIECLARLKVWRIENLMAPHGMDRFFGRSRKDERGHGGKPKIRGRCNE